MPTRPTRTRRPRPATGARPGSSSRSTAPRTPATFRAWMRSLGVRYVMLPDAPLDYSSEREAQLLRTGVSGLRVVGSSPHWTFYALPHPTPIVTPPPGRRATLTYLGQQRVVLSLSGPGTYMVRVRYSPYRQPTPVGTCVRP